MKRGFLTEEVIPAEIDKVVEEQREKVLSDYGDKFKDIASQVKDYEEKLNNLKSTLDEVFADREEDLAQRNKQSDERISQTEKLLSDAKAKSGMIEVKLAKLDLDREDFEKYKLDKTQEIETQAKELDLERDEIRKIKEAVTQAKNALQEKLLNIDSISADIETIRTKAREELSASEILKSTAQERLSDLNNKLKQADDYKNAISSKESDLIDRENKVLKDIGDVNAGRIEVKLGRDSVNRQVEFLRKQTMEFKQFRIQFESNLKDFRNNEQKLRQENERLTSLKSTVETLIENNPSIIKGETQ